MIPAICQHIDVRHGVSSVKERKPERHYYGTCGEAQASSSSFYNSTAVPPFVGQHKAEPCSLWTSRNGGPLGEGMAASVAHPACHNKGRTVSRTATSSQRNQASLGEGEPLDVGCQMRYTAGSIPRADRNVIMHSQYKGALSLNQLTTRQLVTITKGEIR